MVSPLSLPSGIILILSTTALPLHGQAPTVDTLDFTTGWKAAVATVLDRPDLLVPGWVDPFQRPSPVAVQTRLLGCTDDTYQAVPLPSCQSGLGWNAAGEEIPTEARPGLEQLGVTVCDPTCDADGSRTLVSLSPPRLPDSIALRRAPDLAGSIVMEVHALTPGDFGDGFAYGQNVVVVELRRDGRTWRASRLHPIQRQRWPAARIEVPLETIHVTVGDTFRIRWRALDGAGREIDFTPGWETRGGIRAVDIFARTFVAVEMGRAVIRAEAGSPLDGGFQAFIPVNVRDRGVDPAERPPITETLVAQELTGIYEAVVAYYCEHDPDGGIVILDPRIYPHGYHHERLDDRPRHDEERLATLVERTCAEGSDEKPWIAHPTYRRVSLTLPVFKDAGELEVEVVIDGRHGPGDRGWWMSNTAYRLARYPEGWRVVMVEERWIT